MLSYELKEKALQYAEGHISLEELEDWLIPRLPAYLAFQSSTDAEVAGAIELGLAEIGDGLIGEVEFRRSLRSLTASKGTVFASYGRTNVVQTGATNTTLIAVLPAIASESIMCSVRW
jgi:hypothetical protein